MSKKIEIKINCSECKKEIITSPSRIGRKKYCSIDCRTNASIRILDEKRLTRIYKKREGSSNWKGGIWKIRGYIYIYSPNHPFGGVRGYVAEHRLVMEKHIGRYLTKKENVHHINGIKDDNRIENLMLFSTLKEHIEYEYKNRKEFSINSKNTQFKKGIKRHLQPSICQ